MPKFTSDEKLANWFDHPPSSPAIIAAHEQIRAGYKALALEMNGVLPEGLGKRVALRAIYDAMMQANSVVATSQRVYEA